MTRMEEAHEKYSMSDILLRYGIQTNRNGFIICPFHKDNHPSMKIYKDGFKCYSCGAHGDFIDFLAKLENVSLKEALDILEVGKMSSTEASEYAKRREEEIKFQTWCEKRRRLAVLRLDYLKQKKEELKPFCDEWCKVVNAIPFAWQDLEICLVQDRTSLREMYDSEQKGKYIDFALSLFQ